MAAAAMRMRRGALNPGELGVGAARQIRARLHFMAQEKVLHERLADLDQRPILRAS
jgi:hypothetical protein